MTEQEQFERDFTHVYVSTLEHKVKNQEVSIIHLSSKLAVTEAKMGRQEEEIKRLNKLVKEMEEESE